MVKRSDLILFLGAVSVLGINTASQFMPDLVWRYRVYDLGIFSSMMFFLVWGASLTTDRKKYFTVSVTTYFAILISLLIRNEFLYDYGSCIFILILSCYVAYYTKWENLYQKTVSIYFVIDGIKELIEMVANRNTSSIFSLLLSNSALFVLILYAIYRSLKSLSKYGVNSLALDAVYFAVRYPKSFSEWVLSVCGIYPGRAHVVMVDDIGIKTVYKFRKSSGSFEQISRCIYPYKLKDYYLIKINIRCRNLFKKDVDLRLKSKYHILNNNCYTVFRGPFYRQGFRKSFFDFIPQIFIKRLIKHGESDF